MQRIVLVGLLASLAGCTSVQNSNRIASNLKVAEFNSIASQYMERPTFVSVETLSNGEKVLAVEMSTYATDDYGMNSATNRYSDKFANQYIPFIDKYLKWESMAVERKDAFTKDIGSAPAWSNGLDAKLKFTFHSGNESKHYLAVSFCTSLLCLDDKAQYYDRKNSEELKRLLKQLESGSIKETNIDSVYN